MITVPLMRQRPPRKTVFCLSPVLERAVNGRPTGNIFGCGSCDPCRRCLARSWAARVYLEVLATGTGCITNLTIANEWMPSPAVLSRQHIKELVYLVRLALREYKIKVRYFVGAELSSVGRPHYHMMWFGVNWDTPVGNRLFIQVVNDCWKYGHIHYMESNAKTMAYICKYVTKKDDERLSALGKKSGERYQSTRPAIGLVGAEIMATSYLEKASAEQIKYWRETGDLPAVYKEQGHETEVGRILRAYLIYMIGGDERTVERRSAQTRSEAIEFNRAQLALAKMSNEEFLSGLEAMADQLKALVKHNATIRNDQYEAKKRATKRG